MTAKEQFQLQKKLAQLSSDPTPDAKTKKRLKGWRGKVHRLRVVPSRETAKEREEALLVERRTRFVAMTRDAGAFSAGEPKASRSRAPRP